MRRAICLTLLSLTPIALAGCGSHDPAPAAGGPDADLAAAAVQYSAAMRSGTGAQLRRWSCGAYAVVYRNISDDALGLLRSSAARRHGAFSGSTVLRADQDGTAGEVTLADSYLRHGVAALGDRYTLILSKESGTWKVCDTKPGA